MEITEYKIGIGKLKGHIFGVTSSISQDFYFYNTVSRQRELSCAIDSQTFSEFAKTRQLIQYSRMGLDPQVVEGESRNAIEILANDTASR